MPRVYLSLGSNIDPRRHLAAALDALAAHFGALALSPVYENPAVGFIGDNFLNLVVGIDTELAVGELAQVLRRIEDTNARCRTTAKFSSRTLDIDILTYGECVGVIDGVTLPRDEILKYAFVLRPLAELAPDALHPEARKSYRELASALRFPDQQLWPVAFRWPAATP
ncbi:MAG TPA: 2-amino-4-hydroxy-6-hydroxymethyldihydropteridine diphosphokinase [Porticoccaceae bacterium]|nr:2-amino-4-hydroxy-6-hydroxymethyldihydropteridine diphosphokinase [Porticoccaceae bacterium]